MAPSSSWNSSSKISWRWWRKKTNSLARLMSLITALSFGAGSTGGLQIGGRKATLPPTLSRQGTLLVPGSKPRPLHLRQLLFDRLSSHPLRSSVHGQQQERKPRSRSGLVREATPDLLRRIGASEEGVVGTRSDFLQVTRRDRHGKSPTGFDGTADRRGLLCGVMSKVQLKTPLEGTPGREASLLSKEFAHHPHLRGALLKDRQELSHPMQPSYDHDHKCLHKELLGVEIGSSARAL